LSSIATAVDLNLDASDSSAKEVDVPRITMSIRLVNLTAVLVPLIGLVITIALLWGWGFSWLHLWILLGMYLVTSFGVTIGYHRLFTHRSFEAVAPVKLLLAMFGSMAVEGPLTRWVATHRIHHQHSDEHDDPHSPHTHGEGVIATLKGLWHAHVGWIFEPEIPDLHLHVNDLYRDRALRIVSKLFPFWVVLGLLIPALLGGLISQSWKGALLGFLWGGLVRIFLVHHVTWSINSVCHVWGTRPYRTDDHSRNNPVFGILGMGEGWHNNHHAFPTSARHGLKWWQIDVSYWVIVAMEWMRLVRNVRIPPAKALQTKLRVNAA
jgi:stearoyl-CoA desaturase (delta-9 desaturase)